MRKASRECLEALFIAQRAGYVRVVVSAGYRSTKRELASLRVAQ